MHAPRVVRPAAVLTVAALLALPACGSDDGTTSDAASSRSSTPTKPTTSPSGGSTAPGTPASRGGSRRVPETPLATPDPAEFVAGIDNPYLPFRPGTRWVYLSASPDEKTRVVTTVTRRTRVVQGVGCVVVHDVESTLDGEVLEDTYDWYAQDTAGNVWYFGEDTTAYEDGKASTEGSWEAGVDGAQAGVIMLAEPTPGDSYHQEYYAGEAEDQGRVLGLGERITVPYGEFDGLLETADTTPLEPKLVEHKYYARDVGVVYEETVRGGQEQVRLVSMKKAD